MTQADTVTTLIPSLPHRQPSPLDAVVHKAANKLKALTLTRIVGEPTTGDAHDLVRDLLDIAGIVDDALLEIGRYAGEHFGFSDVSDFTDQLRSAIEGNATFAIESAAQKRAEDFRDDAFYSDRNRFLVAAE